MGDWLAMCENIANFVKLRIDVYECSLGRSGCCLQLPEIMTLGASVAP